MFRAGWFQETLIACVYVVCILGIVGCSGGSGNGDDDTTQVIVPPVVADLVDLSFFGSLDQPFSTDRYDYTATVDYNFRFVQITPVTADPDATVTVNGESVISGFASNPIEHFSAINAPIEIVVTSADQQYSKTYRLVVTVLAVSTDANLATLGLSDGSFNPAFNSDTTSYTAAVDYQTSDVQVSAATSQANATITINGVALNSSQVSIPVSLNVGNNNVTVLVTAQDQVNTKTYTITINRAAPDSNADLSSLKISVGVLNPVFRSGILNYSASVVFSNSDVLVSALISQVNATITINGLAVDSGQASNPIPLNVGDNSITVLVTAEDMVSTKAYTININRANRDDNANLSGLTISAGVLDPVFQAQVFDYTASVGFADTSVRVIATAESAFATIRVKNVPVDSGLPSHPVSLGEGSNLLAVTVQAETGRIQKYSLIIERQSTSAFLQQAYLKASNTEWNDLFGYGYYGGSVALSGDTLAVGASFEESSDTGVNGNQADNTAFSSGAVYVFTRDDTGSWSQQAYIKASNTDASDHFGESVALSGDTLAVGVRYEGSSATGVNGDQADNSASAAGAVYVFTRDGTGSWSQQAYIKASNTDAGDWFGKSVALSGDTLAVGASDDSSATGVNGNQADNSTNGSGAVYVFTRDGTGSWSQQAYIKASNADAGDSFGSSVALSGDTLAVGGAYEDSNATGVNGNQADNSASASGAVYVFTRDGTGLWSQQAYIKASNTGATDHFGDSVALSGDTLTVGAPLEDSSANGINGTDTWPGASDSGAVYVFTRDGTGSWSQQAYIKASNTGASDRFGDSVALSDDTLAVGASFGFWGGEDSDATGTNSDETNNLASDSGAVYVFNRDGTGSWSQQAYIKASNTDADDWFGNSIDLSGDTLAVGAGGEDSNATGIDGNQTDNSAPAAGAVYVFR